MFKERKLPPNTKLPGSRVLASLLEVHRKTIVACYDELLLQGWVESIPKKGTFVHPNLPELQQQDFLEDTSTRKEDAIGFQFYRDDLKANNFPEIKEGFMYLNDGTPDTRLTPIVDIARIYRRISNRTTIYKEMNYGTTYGNEKLRNTLAEYLNKTRGLAIIKENILITRGSQMGIYLAAQLLLEKEDIVVVGETNYVSTDTVFLGRGAVLERVSVDEHGLVTKEIEAICKQKKIKAVYVTSHHHHPTTVTLCAERRIHLLNLAKKYSFAIIEDDYDYDFNYNHAPILPLASHDVNGNVVYIGSVCKSVAPVFRVGYLIAPITFVNEASNKRRFIDRQGDALLELTFEEFIKSGDLDRHIKKVMKVYKARRDLFCNLFETHFSDVFTFENPKGGMAIWAQLKDTYSWDKIVETGRKYQLEIGDWRRYDMAKTRHNSMRIGYGSYNEVEMLELINRFRKTIDEIKKSQTFLNV